MVITDDDERLDALLKWTSRLRLPTPPDIENLRANERKAISVTITLTPVDPTTLRPTYSRRVRAVLKDVSSNGMGMVSNLPLNDELYFAEIAQAKQIFFLRRVRNRQIKGNIYEFGFQIIDRFHSIADLQDRMGKLGN